MMSIRPRPPEWRVSLAAAAAIGVGTDAAAQNVEPLLTAPAFVIGALVVPLALVALLLPALWRDATGRRRVLRAGAACAVLAAVSFIAVTRGSGPLTPIWGLVFLGTPWWLALSMLMLRLLQRRR